MIIKEIYIKNFGKFNNFKQCFNEGINIIQGENESGKTTIINFILMVLYGSNSKSKDISKNERKKYFPWNSDTMSGYIILNKLGVDYKIERKFESSNTSDIVNVYELETGEKIKISSSNSPGEYFFSIGYEAFKKTLYISSKSIVIKNDGKKDEITQKLINIVTTGEEDISYKMVIDNLDKKIESYLSKSGHRGLISDLNNEIATLNLDIEEAKVDENEKKIFLNNVEKLKKDKIYIEEKIDLINKGLNKQELKNDLYYKLNNIDDKSKILLINSKKDKIRSLEKDTELIKSKNSRFNINIKDIYLILAVITILLGILISKYIYIATILFVVIYLLNTIKFKKDNNEYLRKNKLEIDKIKKEILEEENNLLLIKKDKEALNKNIDNIKSEINNLSIDSSEISRYSLNEYINTKYNIENEINEINATCKERYRGKENLSTLEKQLDEKNKLRDKLNEEYKLLLETKKIMEKSFKNVEVGFARILNKKASEIICKLTGGKYNNINVSKDFDISIEDRESKNLKEWKYLSSGTIDQLYLSLRLSIINLIISNKEEKILLMDDIFIRYDEVRTKEILELLRENENDLSQVLMFTCHDITNYKINDFNFIKL